MMNWHTMSVERIEEECNTSQYKGLDREEAKKRLLKNGYNVITKAKGKNLFQLISGQLSDFMVLILIVSGAISGLIGYFTDSIIILSVIILNTIIGVFQERKAEKSIDALQKLSRPNAKVIRNGSIAIIPAEELVTGDVVVIEAGDYVPADLRLFESVNLKIQEAAFTGESIAADKHTNIIHDEKVVLGDKGNMVFFSSLVSYGRGKGIVVATGMQTEIGKIANLIQNESIEDTPLKKRLEQLGKVLGIGALIICIVVFFIGLLFYHMNIFEIFLVALSLAVAAIPEGLPATATIVLALGVQRMSKKNAIIRKLPSVETLGSTTVICSDKTGTLTQNKMTVRRIYIDEQIYSCENKVNEQTKLLAKACVLCNDSKIRRDGNAYEVIGDPTETALIDWGMKIDIEKVKLEEREPRIGELPFDSNRKCMSTFHKADSKYFVYTKGSIDEILKKCNKILINNHVQSINDMHIKNIRSANNSMTNDALRVLGVAYKDSAIPVGNHRYEENLIFVGMVGMVDPPRAEAKEAVKKCKMAGIKTIMITGDHKNTAIAIAKELDILSNENESITGSEIDNLSDHELAHKVMSYSVYARVSPEHKMRIVKALKSNHQIVAMTGDGLNDAPALKSADIGIAMGVMGTDVAKEASDMILADDNFATIVIAVEEGRKIFDNIKKVIHFLLSCNIGEIFTVFIAMLIGWSEPLLPIHILWINLVTDSLPALALGTDPADPDIMKRKPVHSYKTVFTKDLTLKIVYQGIMIGALTLLAYNIGIKTDLSTAQTMAFSVLGFGQLVHAFNIHFQNKSIIEGKIFNNIYLILATIVSCCLMFFVLYIPNVREIFEFVPLSASNQLIVGFLSIAPLIIVEMVKCFPIGKQKKEVTSLYSTSLSR